MDIVSPLIYKKIDLMSTMEIKPTDRTFYDKYTKKIVCITDENIQIYNKNGTNLKKSLNLKLSKDKVMYVTLDKLLRYMILNLENKMILVINLKTEKVIEIINYDNTINLLGFFFINNQYSNTYSTDDIKFSLIYTNKIGYYRINIINQNEKITEIKSVKVSLIKSFYYNPEYLVLCVEKKGKVFEFFNLINEKKMIKPHEFILPLKNSILFIKKESDERKSTMQRFLSIFSKENPNKSKKDQLENSNVFTPIKTKETLYKKTQFFLNMIYKKLYFICLNYDESEIQIYFVESLINIQKVKSIPFDSSQISTLQVVDNLIIIHNFERCESIIVDIKSENVDKILFKYFPMSSFEILQLNNEKLSNLVSPKIIYPEDDQANIKIKVEYNDLNLISMVSYDNKMFYDMELEINGHVIMDTVNKQLYLVYFDPSIYYENSNLKYEAIFNLIRRKNSKDTILNALYDLIQSKYSIKILKIVFNKIVRQLYKTIYNKKYSLSEKNNFSSNDIHNPNNNNNTGMNSYDLLNPKYYFMIRKCTIIKQADIYYYLFKNLEFNPKTDGDYIVKVLLQFINSLNNFKIPIQPSFYTILLSFLRKLKNANLINIFLQYHVIPDHYEIAKFLLEMSTEGSVVSNNSTFQLGVDMLVRLGKSEEVFQLFINCNMLYEALSFVNRYKVKIEFISTETFEKMKILIKDNPTLIKDFLLA